MRDLIIKLEYTYVKTKILTKLFILFTAIFLFSVDIVFAQSHSIPSTNTAAHVKKDGTPDMRYKSNKTKHSNYKPNDYARIQRELLQKPPGSTHVSSSGYKHYHYSYGVKRNANGKIERSQTARLSFMKKTGYPHGRPGYVVDHIIPLKKGGCDCTGNMQWQTIADAKAKDKWE